MQEIGQHLGHRSRAGDVDLAQLVDLDRGRTDGGIRLDQRAEDRTRLNAPPDDLDGRDADNLVDPVIGAAVVLQSSETASLPGSASNRKR